ncbi:MAG: copper resistance protein CopC [Anaerolineales bacterium]
MKSLSSRIYECRHLLLLAALSSVLPLMSAIPAAAHSDLVASDPSASEILGVAPETVCLWFEKEIDFFESTVAVFDSKGRQVDLGDSEVNPDDRRELRVNLPTDLKPGEYSVRWAVVDDLDGHPIEGEYSFTIEGPSTDTTLPSTGLILLTVGVAVVVMIGVMAIARRPASG